MLLTPAALWGTSSNVQYIEYCAPVREPPPTGATALEVHQVNRHSRKNARQKPGENVPEEVSHGYILLSGDVPTPGI